MIVAGNKKTGNFNRSLTSFDDPIEFGIVVPIDDPKFLDSYELLTVNSSHTTAATTIAVNEDTDTNIAANYVSDLDGKLIKNVNIGPSTASGSKNIEQSRPAKRTSANLLTIDKDINNTADTLRMALNDEDNIVIAKTPDDWTFAGTGNISVRTPKMVNVKNHANSVIMNIANSDSMSISTPITDEGSISEELTYRFSFYYRLNGSVSMSVYADYYTNSGSKITQHYFSIGSLSYADNENSDFHICQIGFPKHEYTIPEGTKRVVMRIVITASATTVFEFLYPIIETLLNLSGQMGYLSIPYPPSAFSYERKFLNEGDISDMRTTIPSYKTKMFSSHIGRDIYNSNLEFGLLDASFIRILKIIENYNTMGYSISFWPKNANMPPVLIGNIVTDGVLPNFDYNHSDLKIDFNEM